MTVQVFNKSAAAGSQGMLTNAIQLSALHRGGMATRASRDVMANYDAHAFRHASSGGHRRGRGGKCRGVRIGGIVKGGA